MLTELVPAPTVPSPSPTQAGRLPSLRRVVYLGADPQPGGIPWTEFLSLGDRVPASELAACEATLQFDDPDRVH